MQLNLKKTPPNRRDLVLDAAECLFSKRGFDGVTMRQVSNMAGVDVALPNYYFTSKQGLFDAVFTRRAQIINNARDIKLSHVLAHADNKQITVRSIISAFVTPIAELQSHHDACWSNYCRLVALVNSSPELSFMMTTNYDALIGKFIEALRTALPKVCDKKLYWAYHCLSGALTLTMANTDRIAKLSHGLCDTNDSDDAYEHLIAFFSVAFEALEKD